MIRNRTTPAGAALGRELARLVDEAEPRARLVEPLIPPRCASCAFRAGPHVANGSEVTLGDALKCVVENVPFNCHEPARAGQPCSGWAMLHLAHPSAPGSCPWPFSDEAPVGVAEAPEFPKSCADQGRPCLAILGGVVGVTPTGPDPEAEELQSPDFPKSRAEYARRDAPLPAPTTAGPEGRP